jgi:hypothetical protein
VRRLLLGLTCLLAVVSFLPGGATAKPAAPISCGVAETQPAWIDYVDGTVEFGQERFGHPGIVVATGGPQLAAEFRANGAATVDFDLYLRRRVGTPSDPADPDLIVKRADSLFDYAATVTGCSQPLIALNELWGASVPTPWTPTTERYRANVLRFVQRLAERGGRPALLVSSTPATGGEGAAWWRSLGQASDVVLENYWNANLVSKSGPVNGSRMLRMDYRSSAATLLAVGVPASRLGLMIGFQTTPGTGGREGLKPRESWFEVAKLQALAARQVARDLHLGHIWSWGWTMRTAAGKDADKTLAACTWLWARDPSLCNAPELVGPRFDADLREGQIDLPPGVRCELGTAPLTSRSVATLGRFTHDGELALTALVQRAIEAELTHVTTADVVGAERSVVALRFDGNRSAYASARSQSGMSPAVARAILGDELRRRELESRMTVPRPTARDVERFNLTYATALARNVVVTPAPSWLPDGRGLALATSAPATVFRVATGRSVRLRTLDGMLTVRALAAPEQLGTLAPALARSAVVRELGLQRWVEAYADWALRKQKGVEGRLVCTHDRLPEIGVVTLSSFVPFLALAEVVQTAAASLVTTP